MAYKFVIETNETKFSYLMRVESYKLFQQFETMKGKFPKLTNKYVVWWYANQGGTITTRK